MNRSSVSKRLASTTFRRQLLDKLLVQRWRSSSSNVLHISSTDEFLVSLNAMRRRLVRISRFSTLDTGVTAGFSVFLQNHTLKFPYLAHTTSALRLFDNLVLLEIDLFLSNPLSTLSSHHSFAMLLL